MPVRHPLRWVAAAVMLVLVAMAVNTLVTNERFNWPEQFEYIFAPQIMNALYNTVWLTIVAMVGGVVGGVLLALMRLSDNPILRAISWFYLWVFRATPLYTQLLIWGSLGALFPEIGLGIPFGPVFVSWETNTLLSAAAAAALGLVLNEAAYMAEIVRAGILSVDEGQREAAGALGMSRAKTMRRIVLPQAMRVIIPPTGNETIATLKNTSLVAAVPFAELTFQAQNIYGRTYQVIPMLIMVCLWYLLLSSILMVGQHFLERHFGRSERGAARPARPAALLSSGREQTGGGGGGGGSGDGGGG
ncbi:polar amino acid transport system permease protein [Allonocardiopsis opalescens]|uniref:Polar amino acid transport system permease protein n=1 Tax=Allonocardiopsis opalescens TaxID=1144618 RepID=A0A2T0QDN8_9ACTN|nr:polar amino acid transport system permease protein [Allonocardiopsis opalescens]